MRYWNRVYYVYLTKLFQNLPKFLKETLKPVLLHLISMYISLNHQKSALSYSLLLTLSNEQEALSFDDKQFILMFLFVILLTTRIFAFD